MAEVLGALNILNKALPTGVDGTRIAEWELRDGISWGTLVERVALALADVNTDLMNDWGWSFGLTEELFFEYADGGSVTKMPELTDMDRPEPVHGETIGHMIDLRAYGDAIGGSRRYFRDVRSAKIRSSLRTIVNRGVWRFETKLLERWFTNTENAIGSGYDVPFVRGTGGNVDFTPPAMDGEAFTSSHDHYLGVDSDSKDHADVLNELAEHVSEHGHPSPYRALVSKSDVSSYRALTDFVEIVEPVVSMVDRGGATSGAQLFATGERDFGHLGFFHSEYGLIRLDYTARIPSGYAGLMKSYSQDDPRNGLAVRVHPDEGFGFFVVTETSIDDDTPVKQLDVEFEFGVSVGEDRTNGAVARLHSSGSWSNPTIS